MTLSNRNDDDDDNDPAESGFLFYWKAIRRTWRISFERKAGKTLHCENLIKCNWSKQDFRTKRIKTETQRTNWLNSKQINAIFINSTLINWLWLKKRKPQFAIYFNCNNLMGNLNKSQWKLPHSPHKLSLPSTHESNQIELDEFSAGKLGKLLAKWVKLEPVN